MRDEFFDLIDDEILDVYLEQISGHEAVEEVELGSVSKIEHRIIIDGLITAYNKALDDANAAHAAVYYRHIQRLVDRGDDELREHYEHINEGMNLGDIVGGHGKPPF